MTEDKANLVDKCLIATPAIKDPLFASSLVYICEHSKDGSMGLVVNHQTSQTLEDIFVQGSPKRQLNSSTLGVPSAVIMTPA